MSIYRAADDRFRDLIVEDAVFETLAEGFRFTEGPSWHPAERHVTFTDIPSNRIHRWHASSGTIEVLREPSNMTNGTCYDARGRLLMCEHASSRGISIICQKPLAPTLEESVSIVQRAKEGGVRFMAHENFRWQPWYREVKRVLSRGLIGDPTHLYFRMRTGDGWGQDAYLARQPFFRDYPRLLVYETAVHFIDTFRFLLGEVTLVFAKLRRLNPVIRGEDAGQILLSFESGATAIIDANRYNEAETPNPRYTFGELRLDGTQGHLAMDADSSMRIKPLGQDVRPVEYQRENLNFAGDCVYHLQRHFIDRMLDGESFESTGEDYLKTLAVVDAVYASAESGEAVRL